MHYEINISVAGGNLFTGLENGQKFMECSVAKGRDPTSICILYHHNQTITSSFFYGILTWFQVNFKEAGLGYYSFTRMIKLINTDDLIMAELNRAIQRL